MRKLRSLGWAALMLLVLVVIWQIVCATGLVPEFMLPPPLKVAKTFIKILPVMLKNARISLTEAGLGLLISIFLSLIMGLIMDRFSIIHRMVFPLLVLTQTVPVVAIAPLIVLWFGYDMAPKVILIVIVCFFPITVSFLEGLRSVDSDSINLMRSMKATTAQIYRHVKLPMSLPSLFGGLKISVSYSVVGAVIAEWLGGDQGLGVYMTQVRKSYAFDKMFAVIVFISLLSLILIQLVGLLEHAMIRYKKT